MYSDEALEAWPRNSPVISCSLPLSGQPLDALAYCQGLLPEGHALQELSTRAGVATNDTFDLLARYGRDVAGALVISERPPDGRRFDVEPLTDDGLAVAVADLEEHPLGAHDDSELSLAGLQDKLLLVDLGDGQWGRPLRGRPSTHILKLDHPRHPGLVRAEATCLTLARIAGLTTVDVQLRTFDGIEALVVSRFDRRVKGDQVVRVHQEDLCQALAVDPAAKRGTAKYERAGGPDFKQAARLLDEYADQPSEQLEKLVRVVTFTVLIGNADAHGKNLALLHVTPEAVDLAPLYDTVPTLLWPKLRSDAAMRVGGKSSLRELTVDDIVEEAKSWNFPGDHARDAAMTTIDAVVSALAGSGIDADDPVESLVRDQARRLVA